MADWHGFLNINKPEDVTSHDVVLQIRKNLETKTVGHSGTLDPFATGVLIVAVGFAVKLIEFLSDANKSYRATMILGRETDTYDLTGKQTALYRGPRTPSIGEIRLALQRFRGPLAQIPPMYSALKRGGVPLYQLARKGIEVTREPRKITIYELNLLEYNYPLLRIELRCSSGTYVRSLAHDLGRTLGTGAYLHALLRTAVGKFSLADSVPPEAAIPVSFSRVASDCALALGISRADLTTDQIKDISRGKDINISQNTEHLIGYGDQPLALLSRVASGRYHPKKVNPSALD